MSGTSGQIAGQLVLFTGQPLDTGRTFVRLVQTPDRHGTRLSVSMSKSLQLAISNKMKNSINQYEIHHRLGGNKGDRCYCSGRLLAAGVDWTNPRRNDQSQEQGQCRLKPLSYRKPRLTRDGRPPGKGIRHPIRNWEGAELSRFCKVRSLSGALGRYRSVGETDRRVVKRKER